MWRTTRALFQLSDSPSWIAISRDEERVRQMFGGNQHLPNRRELGLSSDELRSRSIRTVRLSAFRIRLSLCRHSPDACGFEARIAPVSGLGNTKSRPAPATGARSRRSRAAER